MPSSGDKSGDKSGDDKKSDGGGKKSSEKWDEGPGTDTSGRPPSDKWSDGPRSDEGSRQPQHKERNRPNKSQKGKNKDDDDDDDDDKDDDKDDEELGTIVYQNGARYICIGALRVAGGVRVLFNVKEKQAYIQIISPICEVFITYYANNMTFLTSTSAAGVAWAAAIYVKKEKDDKDNQDKDKDKNKDNQDKDKNKDKDKDKNKNKDTDSDKGNGKKNGKENGKSKKKEAAVGEGASIPKCNLPEASKSVIDTAHVIFCDPYQAQRLRTVLETLKSATECTVGLVTPCIFPNERHPNFPCPPGPPSTMVDPTTYQRVCQPPYPPPCVGSVPNATSFANCYFLQQLAQFRNPVLQPHQIRYCHDMQNSYPPPRQTYNPMYNQSPSPMYNQPPNPMYNQSPNPNPTYNQPPNPNQPQQSNQSAYDASHNSPYTSKHREYDQSYNSPHTPTNQHYDQSYNSPHTPTNQHHDQSYNRTYSRTNTPYSSPHHPPNRSRDPSSSHYSATSQVPSNYWSNMAITGSPNFAESKMSVYNFRSQPSSRGSTPHFSDFDEPFPASGQTSRASPGPSFGPDDEFLEVDLNAEGFIDPYSLDYNSGKILFCAPACLVRLSNDMIWTDLQKGSLKIYQCPGQGGYSIVLENNDRAVSKHQYLTADTLFKPSEKTQFGFTYNTVTRSEGSGNLVEHFLVSFMNSQVAEQFKCVVDNIRLILESRVDEWTGPDGEKLCS